MSAEFDAQYKKDEVEVKGKIVITKKGKQVIYEFIPVAGESREITVYPRSTEGKHLPEHKLKAVTAKEVLAVEDSDNERLMQDLRIEKDLVGPTLSPEVESQSLAVLRQQCDQVHQEIINRRQCRHSLFMVTMICMITAGFALIGFVKGFGGIENARRWIMFGTMIPLGVLTIATLITIHKARAISYRIGFLAAFQNQMQSGTKAVYTLRTWLNALRIVDYCTNHMRKKGKAPCGDEKPNTCIARAEAEAQKITKLKSMFKYDFFKSFAVLSTVIYGLLYVLVSGLFIWASNVSYKLEEWGKPVLYHTLILISIILATIVISAFVSTPSSPADKGWKRVLKISRTIARVCCFFAGVLVVIGSVFHLLRIEPPISNLPVFFMSGAIFTVIFLGIELYWQAYSIRKGKYSVETYYELWNNRLNSCDYIRGEKDIP